MQHLVKLVEKFSLVPKHKILTAKEYKAIYDQRLIKIVNDRLDLLMDGKMSNRDFTIPGVIDFLDSLSKLDIPLYVASGTDRKHVMYEANVLGVAHYFQGIYGSDPKIPEFPKEWLVGRVIDWLDLTPDNLLTIGDGPVEIEATKKYGGFAVGVATCKSQKDGLNPAKRQRLLRAGADIIITDFLEQNLLLHYFFNASI